MTRNSDSYGLERASFPRRRNPRESQRSTIVISEKRPIDSIVVKGRCSRGEKCKLIRGSRERRLKRDYEARGWGNPREIWREPNHESKDGTRDD